jgi:prepilin-type N-terminal cleavage/methylation domain-containing protein
MDRGRTMKNRYAHGFTLVETLVTAIIMGIIVVIAVTVFTMHNNQLRESIAMEKLQRQYENIIDQIALHVRNGNRVLDTSDPVPASFNQYPTPQLLNSNSKKIFIYNGNGVVIGGYFLLPGSPGFFQELDIATNTWINFEAGGGWVEIDETNCSFSLPALRSSVEISLRLETTMAGKTYYLPPRKDGFTCRNSPL